MKECVSRLELQNRYKLDRLQKSDIDVMYWQLDYQVIWEFSQSKCFNLNKQVLFLADSSKSPPGFTLLWLPYGRTNEDIFQFV